MMKFTAAGDAIIQRRIQEGYLGFSELTPFINQGDARFFNLETTLNYEGECYGNQFSGGTYIRTNPEALIDMKRLGFNMMTFNNNHIMDFGFDGMMKTLGYVEKSDFVHAGVGRNLAAASAPRYLDTANGRVALISVNTSFDACCMAGRQSERVPGRPGLNGIRMTEQLEVTQEELTFLRGLGDRLGINIDRDIFRREGYYPPLADTEAELGKLKFILGEKTKRSFIPNEEDMQRVGNAIYEAKLQADYVMVSVHAHDIDGQTKEDLPHFLKQICRRYVDMGADAIVGHGPHLLQPIEVYNDKPIFYSLGDFILQLYSIEFAPADFFEKNGLGANDTVHNLLKKRSHNFTVGLMEDRKMMETVIPYWETKNGNLTSLRLMPVELMGGDCKKGDSGLPIKARNYDLVDRLAAMSAPLGIKMTVEKDGIVTCKW